jgi:hypothetical protein|tara:strand:+ start:824 stop:1273 length:450 start_codon:yes stop_codon:yes gene_type:complete
MRNIPGMINSFDIDGVIYMGKYEGVFPGPHDIIITGRSKEEEPETSAMLLSKGISNKVYMNPTPFDNKTREDSGRHKGQTLFYLEQIGMRFGIHFEDDPVQAEIISKMMPHINVVLLQHELVEKENVRHVWHNTGNIKKDERSKQLQLL